MSEYVQLFMKRSLENLPPICLKEGYGIHTHIEGREDIWENIIEGAFCSKYSFREWLVPLGNYRPEYIMYVNYMGKDIATAMGTENPKFPGED